MAVKKESRLRGRFKQEIDSRVQRYLASIPFDWRLYRYDIEGSLAHAEMLARQGIITQRRVQEDQDWAAGHPGRDRDRRVPVQA